MNKYIVNNIEDRQHYKIYGSVGSEAFFDLDSSQHGWDDFSKITTGDIVYVINANKRVILGYKVTSVLKDVVLEDDPKLGQIYKSSGEGTITAIFGEGAERVGEDYSIFVKENKITNPKINSKTGKILQGFNCAAFD
ncbi:MAG: hypothetical protein ACI9FR_002859 [Cryomorphaceae bacterium]|jgi:hypothetical protein